MYMCDPRLPLALSFSITSCRSSVAWKRAEDSHNNDNNSNSNRAAEDPPPYPRYGVCIMYMCTRYMECVHVIYIYICIVRWPSAPRFLLSILVFTTPNTMTTT